MRLGALLTRLRFVVVSIVAVCSLAAAVVASALYLRAKRPSRVPNVALIVVDTLRADHLGCYGYYRKTSPRIDGLAEVSTLHRHAFASSPWTLPTHASLFTGKYSFEHGAHTYLLKEPDTLPADKKRIVGERPLKTGHLTLAELLSQNGFRTGAVSANVGFLSRRWKLDQGFHHYKVKYRHGRKLNRMVFSWLDRVRRRPFFLFINYMDTHRVYNTKPRQGLLRYPVIRDKGELLDKLMYRVMDPEKNQEFPKKVADKVAAQYDTAITNADEAVGDVLDYLEKHRLYDDTLIVVTSDHGEFLGEHQLAEHSKDLYQEVLHVPLIIKSPRQKKGRVSSEVVSSVDLPGMIVRELGGAVARKGARVFGRIPENHPVLSENYYSRSKDVTHPIWGKRFRRIRAALFDYPYKYILSSDGRDEMYHLESDRTESRNLVGRHPGRAKRYRAELNGYVESSWKKVKTKGKAQANLTETERDQLRELGYLE
jgi:arylsulfatase A-like enzyme